MKAVAPLSSSSCIFVSSNSHNKKPQINLTLTPKNLKPKTTTSISCKKTSQNETNKMEDYNTAMKRMMRNPYEYHHDLGQYAFSFFIYLLFSDIFK